MTKLTENSLTISNRSSVLKEYYSRYLTDIRGVKPSSVQHYYSGLNTISVKLREMGLIETDIYEIMDIETLNNVREILFADPDFKEMDTRGRRMYSAGLNNYYRFVSGEGFKGAIDQIGKLDMPVLPEEPQIIEQIVYKRSNILRTQTLYFADYKCEINSEHRTFITEIEKLPYMECHHAIPLSNQPFFKNSLDVYANLVCLCPVCHRMIHYGIIKERTQLIHQIYESRADRLANSGLKLSKDEFTEFAIKQSY